MPRLIVSGSGSVSAFNPVSHTCTDVAVLTEDTSSNATMQERFNFVHIAMELLKKPSYIYKGLKREGFDDGLCYVGTPEASWPNGKQAKRPEKQVFLVCMNAQKEIFEWRWEQCDPCASDRPEGFADRYDKQVFPEEEILR